MMESQLMGSIMLFAFDFVPKGWAKCDGTIMTIASNPALYDLIRNRYGGDGETTFALPDLRGRAPIGAGFGPNLTARSLGDKGGTESVQLTQMNLPAHTHSLMASASAGNQADPSGNVLANSGAPDYEYNDGGPNTMMSSQSIGSSGGDVPVNHMPPYIAMNYCIAVYGTYPSGN